MKFILFLYVVFEFNRKKVEISNKACDLIIFLLVCCRKLKTEVRERCCVI